MLCMNEVLIFIWVIGSCLKCDRFEQLCLKLLMVMVMFMLVRWIRLVCSFLFRCKVMVLVIFSFISWVCSLVVMMVDCMKLMKLVWCSCMGDMLIVIGLLQMLLVSQWYICVSVLCSIYCFSFMICLLCLVIGMNLLVLIFMLLVFCYVYSVFSFMMCLLVRQNCGWQCICR